MSHEFTGKRYGRCPRCLNHVALDDRSKLADHSHRSELCSGTGLEVMSAGRMRAPGE